MINLGSEKNLFECPSKIEKRLEMDGTVEWKVFAEI